MSKGSPCRVRRMAGKGSVCTISERTHDPLSAHTPAVPEALDRRTRQLHALGTAPAGLRGCVRGASMWRALGAGCQAGVQAAGHTQPGAAAGMPCIAGGQGGAARGARLGGVAVSRRAGGAARGSGGQLQSTSAGPALILHHTAPLQPATHCMRSASYLACWPGNRQGGRTPAGITVHVAQHRISASCPSPTAAGKKPAYHNTDSGP